MPYKTISELFNAAELSLPYLEIEDRRSFLFHFKNKMDLYLVELATIPESEFGGIDKNSHLDRITFISKALIEILSQYLEGFPAKAFSLFEKMITYANLETELLNLRTITLDSGSQFYRVKKEYNVTKFAPVSNGINGHLEPIDLFHVPFEKRRAIGTNRFSIPGFPSLYLSDVLLTSWSECFTGLDSAFHAVSFKNHRPLYIVDLVPITDILRSGSHTGTLYGYIDINDAYIDYTVTFPLISACHSKVLYNPDYTGEIQFKSEYIIPQLLLQWYREKKLMVDGIRYLSCTAENRFPGTLFSKYNYVIPVIQCNETGYCDKLLRNFSATNVYSYLDVDTTTSPNIVLDEILSILSSSTFTPL